MIKYLDIVSYNRRVSHYKLHCILRKGLIAVNKTEDLVNIGTGYLTENLVQIRYTQNSLFALFLI